MAGAFDGAKQALEHDISPVVFRLEDARALNELARAQNRCQRVHLKVDTGMLRLGVSIDEWPEFLRGLAKLSNLHVAGIATHFASSDQPDLSQTKRQNERFIGALSVAKELGFSPELIHAANSCAAMRLPESRYNMVRAGIALYGVDPSRQFGDALSTVLTMETAIIQIKEVPAGRGVSYSHTWVAPVDSTLAVLPVGYADGYKRALSNRADVVIRGVRCPVRGNICMDLTLVDVTALNGAASVGDRVELIGATVGPHELSQHADTIPYEIFTGISLRVPRNYR
jgi:alanine racemase